MIFIYIINLDLLKNFVLFLYQNTLFRIQDHIEHNLEFSVEIYKRMYCPRCRKLQHKRVKMKVIKRKGGYHKQTKYKCPECNLIRMKGHKKQRKNRKSKRNFRNPY